MKVLQYISRTLLGLLFIFSGFVKALDPLGSAYKFGDYFQAFGIDFLDSLSLPLGIFLSAFELVLGIVLLLGYQKRITYWVLLVFMSFFTLLTFILALTNPVTDCGCFGDAIIMTNWQTFLKNIIFMLFVLILFRNRKRAQNHLDSSVERFLIILFFLGSFSLSLFSLRHLPVLDFRPYDIGTHIPDDMSIPEGAPADEYNTILIYQNLETGNNEEFTLENYPEDTTKYAFVTSESKLISKGYEPPIHDFGITDPEGYDVTDEVLNFKGYTLLLVSHNLEKADEQALVEMNDWAQLDNLAADYKFIPLSASSSSIVDEVKERASIDFNFYTADEIMLKTMIRSNPGMLLLKNGTIVGKWAYRDFPSMEIWNKDWKEIIEQYQEEQDPEIMMLIEEGFMEEISWDLIDFDLRANSLLLESKQQSLDKLVWVIFILSIGALLCLLQFLPRKKQNWRD